MNFKVKINFIRIQATTKVPFATHTADMMTGNLNFPTPDVPLAEIHTAADDLSTKIIAAAGGSTLQKQERDAAEKVLDTKMRKLAAYVQRVANGDDVIITSSGFTAYEPTHAPTQPPGKQENVKVKHGQQPGTVLMTSNKADRAKGYITFVMTLAPVPYNITDGSIIFNTPIANPIVTLASTGTKRSFLGLESGTRYYIISFAVNAKGIGPVSDVISIIAP